MKRLIFAASALGLVLGLGACGAITVEANSPSTSSATAELTSNSLETPKRWVEVFRASVSQNDEVTLIETETFRLDGNARLRYIVSGTPNRPTGQGRAAEINFQDMKLNTENSRIDTTIDVDEPGEGTHDLGERDGCFYVCQAASESSL
ncbi:hypothetical protein IU487_36155 [Nocardia puris]|uniref:hypothetical protein n=1 Tax=Nocardia puris TaxID=208602 RepID=UPI00189337C5|nr:hypothetical protein [Nocardia puris]MBF6216418.1 hypothetical protein [Nocardia puris]